MKKIICYFFAIALITIGNMDYLNAQSKTFEGIRAMKLRNIGAIVKDRLVKGYYMFYEVDKVDRKTREYSLQIMDANLNELGRKKIIDSKHVILLESAFNGENIMMKFYDRKQRSVDFRIYNQQAELVSKKTRELEKWELSAYSSIGESGEITNKTIYSIDDSGFVEFVTKKKKKTGYEIKYYPNAKGGKKWTKSSPDDAKEHLIASCIGTSKDIVLAQVFKQKSALKVKDATFNLLALDAKTGKKIFQKEMTDTKYELQVLNAYLKEDGSNEVAVLGQFYKKGANEFKDKSLGLFSFVYDNTGKILHKNFAQWERDFGKFVNMTKKGKIVDVGYIYFHEVIQTADGKIFAVGETFKKVVSALGVASRVLEGQNSNASAMKMVVEDMVMIEFTPEFKLKDVQFFDKSKTNFQMERGEGTIRMMVLAQMMKYNGYFDYTFTQRNEDNSEFVVGYVDFQRGKKDERGLTFGAIGYADGELTTDKIPMKSKKWTVYPKKVLMAKPGYVLISEYNRKEKKLEVVLEQINY